VLVRAPLSGRADPVPAIEARTPMPSALFPSDHLAVTVRIER
jgi:hypothetical protein